MCRVEVALIKECTWKLVVHMHIAINIHCSNEKASSKSYFRMSATKPQFILELLFRHFDGVVE
jgi:hypothetical protein